MVVPGELAGLINIWVNKSKVYGFHFFVKRIEKNSEISQNLLENTCVGVSCLLKLQAWDWDFI